MPHCLTDLCDRITGIRRDGHCGKGSQQTAVLSDQAHITRGPSMAAQQALVEIALMVVERRRKWGWKRF